MANLVAIAYDDVDSAKEVMRYGGRVMHSSLLDEAEADLQEALSAPTA